MKNIRYLLLAFLTILISCSKTDNSDELKNDSLESDKDLIRAWIFNDYNPDMNPGIDFTLNDLTTSDIMNKLEARVYTVKCDVPGLSDRAVFIKDSNVYDLGRYNLFGANEPENIYVTDLDADSNYELFFTLTHGSGILRTNIVCYINGLDDLYLRANGEFLFPLDYDISIQPNKNYLDIIYKTESVHEKIGKISLVEENNELKCFMELNENLPQSVLNDISGKD